MTRFDQIATLERCVKQTSLADVLYDLGVVCGVKASLARETGDWKEYHHWDWLQLTLDAAENSVRDVELRFQKQAQNNNG